MRKIIPAVLAGAAVLIAAGGSFGYAALDKDVHVSVDGVDESVSTMAGTVGEVLASKGIELGDHDVVAPTPETKLTDGTQIAVQYGRQIRVTVDGQQQLYWTTATRVGDALASLDVPSEGAALSTSRSTPIGREGLSFTLATRKTITINNAGRPQRISTTAQTVAAALAAAKIRLDSDDEVSLGEDTPVQNGTSFTVTKVDVVKVVKKERVKYPIRYTDDERLEKGKTEIKAPGKPGVRKVEITEVRHNGKLQSRQETATLATPPKAEVVRRGTKEPEPAEPADEPRAEPPSTTGDGESDQDTDDPGTDPGIEVDPGTELDPGADSGDTARSKTDETAGVDDAVWDRVAQCESGQNWSINTGSGYYGGLQFAGRSWKAYGGTEFAPLASQATREQQIVVAEKILADVGWKAWPACSKKLGLR